MAFNIEADVMEKRNVVTENSWVMTPYLQAIGGYKATLKDHPNPPVANVTLFRG
jgi:hypothetical protein